MDYGKRKKKNKKRHQVERWEYGRGIQVVGGEKWENGYNYFSLNSCMKFSRIKKNYKNTRTCAYFYHTIFYYYVMLIYYNKLFLLEILENYFLQSKMNTLRCMIFFPRIYVCLVVQALS